MKLVYFEGYISPSEGIFRGASERGRVEVGEGRGEGREEGRGGRAGGAGREGRGGRAGGADREGRGGRAAAVGGRGGGGCKSCTIHTPYIHVEEKTHTYVCMYYATQFVWKRDVGGFSPYFHRIFGSAVGEEI
jgi:hypothetical protein